MSAEFSDRARVGEKLEVEYGFSLESVTFLDRLNYFSPYGRATYNEDENSSFEFGFSSGVPPAGLFTAGREPGRELQRDLSQLALSPRVSLRGGRVRVQRTENFELAYRRTVGSRAFSVAGYRESLVNAAVTMIAPGGIPDQDVLPDLMSNSSVFNIGDYAGLGYMATVSQALGEKFSAALAYGGGNALVPMRSDLETTGPEEVRIQAVRLPSTILVPCSDISRVQYLAPDLHRIQLTFDPKPAKARFISDQQLGPSILPTKPPCQQLRRRILRKPLHDALSRPNRNLPRLLSRIVTNVHSHTTVIDPRTACAAC